MPSAPSHSREDGDRPNPHPLRAIRHPMSVTLSEQTWQAFQSATHTLAPTPGFRARWHAGRTTYAVWMVRVDGPRLRSRVARLQRALTPWLHPIPLDNLHVTIRVAGFMVPRAQPDPRPPNPLNCF